MPTLVFPSNVNTLGKSIKQNVSAQLNLSCVNTVLSTAGFP